MACSITKSIHIAIAYLSLIRFPMDGLGEDNPNIWHLDQDYVEHSWTKAQGLPDNWVQSIAQSRDGYLWLATRYGLARFDGLRFVVFNHANTPDMVSDNCLVLAEDTEGAIWVATPAGLLRHDHGTIRMQWKWDGLGNDSLMALCPGRHGGMWVGNEKGLNFIRDRQQKQYDETDGLLSTQVTAVLEDASGVIWVGTKKGLQSLSDANGGFKESRPARQTPGLGVVSIVSGDKGCLWVLFEDPKYPENRADLFRLVDGLWTEAWPNRLANRGRRTFLTADRHGGWLGCHQEDNGWMRFREGKLMASEVLDLLSGQVPVCAHEDREGNLWVGTESHGLHRLTPRRTRTLTTDEGLTHNYVRAAMQSSDGSMWMGTDGGLSRYREGQFSQFSKATGLAERSVRGLTEDRWGRVWIGTSGGGLNAINGENLFTVRLPGDNIDNKIRTIYSSKKGVLWIGTLRALHQLQLRSDSFEGVRTGVSLAAGLLGTLTTFTNLGGFRETDVRALIEDAHGMLWVGTSGQGIYSIRGNQVERIPGANAPSSDFVWAFHEDAEGIMWIGTDRGLGRYQAGRLTVFTTDQGLPDNLVNSILEDNSGNLWIGHDHGIYRARKRALNDVAAGTSNQAECVTYDEEDGLLSTETNGQTSYPAACNSLDGRLWFSTTKGMVVFDPMNLPDLTSPPPVVIERVRANGATVLNNNPRGHSTVTGSSTGLRGLTQRNEKVVLSPGSARILEFEYTANTFNAANKIRFKYRLEGVDKNWIDAGDSRKAYYANLSPGDYQFRVIAANKHAVWNETGASFAFHYSPFFYQTSWFYMVTGLSLLTLIFAAYRWRMTELRKIHWLRQEAALLRERERIGRDLHDSLGANLTQLSLLVDLADRRSDDPNGERGEQRRKFSDLTRDAMHALQEIIWAADPGDSTLEGLTARICQNAEEFFGAAGIRCRFDLPTELPRCALTPDQRHNLLMVAKEALNNIAKHASASEVWIRASVADSVCTLTIEDNGRGFDAHINQSPTINHEPIPSGHGLANMQKRVEDIGGRLDVESLTAHGTKISINLALNGKEDDTRAKH